MIDIMILYITRHERSKRLKREIEHAYLLSEAFEQERLSRLASKRPFIDVDQQWCEAMGKAVTGDTS